LLKSRDAVQGRRLDFEIKLTHEPGDRKPAGELDPHGRRGLSRL
jgi:hypothetical protein